MAYLGDHDNLLPDGKPRNNQSVVAEGTKAFCNLPPSSNVAVGLAAGEANRATTFSSFQHHICYFLVNVQTLRIKLTFYSPKVIIHLIDHNCIDTSTYVPDKCEIHNFVKKNAGNKYVFCWTAKNKRYTANVEQDRVISFCSKKRWSSQ